MKKIENLATFFIGFSYSFLIYNKIAFGVSLIVGVLILLISNYHLFLILAKKFYVKITKIDLFIILLFFISFLISSFIQ